MPKKNIFNKIAQGYRSSVPKSLRKVLRKAGNVAINEAAETLPGGTAIKIAKMVNDSKLQAKRDRRAAKKAAKQQQVVVGDSFSSKLGSWFGRGDYFANNLFQEAPRSIPRFGASGTEVTVSKTEFVCDVTCNGTTGFVNTMRSINPGLETTFPFLSQLAQNYEEYEFISLAFFYKPNISEYMNASATGNIIGAAVYNASTPMFTGKPEMVQYDSATSVRPCDTCTWGFECDPSRRSGSRSLLTRSGNVPSGQDPKLYDMGTFQLAQSGLPTTAPFTAGSVIGELWVSYSCRLAKPKLRSAIGYGIQSDYFFSNAPTTAKPFASAQMMGNNTLGGFITNTGTYSKYIFPDNFTGYVKVIGWYNAGTTAAAPTVVLNGSIAQVTDMTTDGTTAVSNVQNGVTTFCVWMYTLFISAPASVAYNNWFTMTSTFTGGGTASLYVFEYNHAAVSLPTVAYTPPV